ncbi:hypothetical protein tb265_07100 [Gemmatimonadetes bacterium T265]|nr:hypothetical protein tb265_07100 [Gemmatimonadetes bacterium T265]
MPSHPFSRRVQARVAHVVEIVRSWRRGSCWTAALAVATTVGTLPVSGQAGPRSVPLLDTSYRFAGLPWGARPDVVRRGLDAAGFHYVERTVHGDLKYTGRVFGRPAYLWVFMERDTLVRVVAQFRTSHPNSGRPDTALVRAVEDSVLSRLGQEPRVDADSSTMRWPAAADSGDYRVRLADRTETGSAYLYVTAPGVTRALPRPTYSTGASAVDKGVQQDLSPDFADVLSTQHRIGAPVALRAAPDTQAHAIRMLRPGETLDVSVQTFGDDFRMVLMPSERSRTHKEQVIGYIYGPTAVLEDVPDDAPTNIPAYGTMGPCTARARAVHRRYGRGPDETSRSRDDDGEVVSWWYWNMQSTDTGRPATVNVDFYWGRFARGCRVSSSIHEGEP